MKFERWLGSLLKQSEREVQLLLSDSAALQFLIAWSLFESKCFDGFVKIDRLQTFSERVAAEGCDPDSLDAALAHFHQRYQDKELYRQLMHGQVSNRMDSLLRGPLSSFSGSEKIFFLSIVAYRYRNNMFHGNKGVQSWLAYAEQIRLCTTSIGHFVSHAELRRPSLPERQVA